MEIRNKLIENIKKYEVDREEKYMSYDYKVIKILNEKTILINCGYSEDTKKGDKFRIFEQGEAIIFENENLGDLNKIKTTVEAVEVYENFSVCQKIVISESNPFDLLPKMLRTIEKAEELKVEEEEISNLKYRSSEHIRVGDFAERIK